MRKHALVFALAILLAVPALAREVNTFTVKDGQGSYPFALADTEMKLFFYTHQSPDSADMRSKVFTYRPTGPAPLDSPVAREEIAKAVKWLFYNEKGEVDIMHPSQLPGDITCYPIVMGTSGSSMDGLGLRITVENETIRKVEVASCVTCGMMAKLVKGYEIKGK